LEPLDEIDPNFSDEFKLKSIHNNDIGDYRHLYDLYGKMMSKMRGEPQEKKEIR
jgi:hypothetical protein